jgi:hypothetical protein
MPLARAQVGLVEAAASFSRTLMGLAEERGAPILW